MAGTGDIVLAVADAIAVLIASNEQDVATRDAIAAAALRRSTGRRDIVIERRPSGRPRLAPPYPELAVSLSRRGELLLAGFAPTGRVGVDIETIGSQAVPEPARLARDHLAPAEAAVVAALPIDAGRLLFLRLWTAKEAALKLTGRGVYDGMRMPDLSAALGALARDDSGPIEARLPDLGAVELSVRTIESRFGPHLCALARSAAGN